MNSSTLAAMISLTTIEPTVAGLWTTLMAMLPLTPEPSPAVAVMVAVPMPTHLTTPSLTVATSVSDEDQITSSVVSAGVTVATRVSVSSKTVKEIHDDLVEQFSGYQFNIVEDKDFTD